ncbi:hypothetical protein FB451DRAFT_1553929 [Mycena latifolia]|nr:hypothetical protein FB451DRAFT_1553929 [Mycena latifolia]
MTAVTKHCLADVCGELQTTLADTCFMKTAAGPLRAVSDSDHDCLGLPLLAPQNPLKPDDHALLSGPIQGPLARHSISALDTAACGEDANFIGVLAAQIYFYHENFSDDRPAIKLLVYGLELIDVLQTVTVTADAFQWFVYGFCNMAQLDETFLNVPFLDSIISLVIQAFYCWRIYFLRKGDLIPGLILVVSLAQCAAGIIPGVKAQLGRLSLISTEVITQTVHMTRRGRGGRCGDCCGALVGGVFFAKEAVLPATQSMIARTIRLIVETNALAASLQHIASQRIALVLASSVVLRSQSFPVLD